MNIVADMLYLAAVPYNLGAGVEGHSLDVAASGDGGGFVAFLAVGGGVGRG